MPSDRDDEGAQGRRVPGFLRDDGQAGGEPLAIGPQDPGDDEGLAYDDIDAEDDRRGGLARLLLKIGVAGAAVAVFVGVIWYAYLWGSQQAGDEPLPVVRAEDGPDKVRPEDPGGMDVPHQDKLVMNETGEGDGETAENLLPPPETPQDPDDGAAPADGTAADGSDAAQNAEADAAERDAGANGRQTAQAETAQAETEQTETAQAEPEQTETEQTETDQTGMPETPPAPSESADTDGTGDGAAAETAPETKPETAEPEAAEPEAAEPETAEPDAAAGDDGAGDDGAGGDGADGDGADGEPAAPAGARLAEGDIAVQLAAFRSEEAARGAWDRLQQSHAALLGDQALSLQRVEIEGKGTFWRVRTGPFPNRATAKDMCAQLEARDQACLVVTQ